MCGVAELPLYRVPVCIVFFKVLYQHVSTQFDCSGIKRYAVLPSVGAFYRDDFGSLAEKCGLQK